jgi:hypothetical protein
MVLPAQAYRPVMPQLGKNLSPNPRLQWTRSAPPPLAAEATGR